jgi:hypothetical protein
MAQTEAQLITLFDTLLKQHRILAGESNPLAAKCVQLKSLLNNFVEKSRQREEAELKALPGKKLRFVQLLKEYEPACERLRRNQEATADDFNLLEVMKLTGDELRHSMLLAWLLDHRLSALGTHAQGSLGFFLFLNEFDLPAEWAQTRYSVHREVSGDCSRIDIRIQAPGSFIIDIENKIWSDEGDNQTIREWEDLQEQAKELKIPSANVRAFFLTPDGRKANNSNFQPAAWKQIARILKQFADEAKPLEVKLFASHYAEALKRFVIVERPIEENEDEKDI